MQAGGMNRSQWLNPPQGDNSLHLVISPPPFPSPTQGEFMSPETSLSSALLNQWVAGYFCLLFLLVFHSLFQTLSREKNLFCFFLHSISELKSHVMAKFCNRHNQMEKKKAIRSEVKLDKINSQCHQSLPTFDISGSAMHHHWCLYEPLRPS